MSQESALESDEELALCLLHSTSNGRDDGEIEIQGRALYGGARLMKKALANSKTPSAPHASSSDGSVVVPKLEAGQGKRKGAAAHDATGPKKPAVRQKAENGATGLATFDFCDLEPDDDPSKPVWSSKSDGAGAASTSRPIDRESSSPDLLEEAFKRYGVATPRDQRLVRTADLFLTPKKDVRTAVQAGASDGSSSNGNGGSSSRDNGGVTSGGVNGSISGIGGDRSNNPGSSSGSGSRDAGGSVSRVAGEGAGDADAWLQIYGGQPMSEWTHSRITIDRSLRTEQQLLILDDSVAGAASSAFMLVAKKLVVLSAESDAAAAEMEKQQQQRGGPDINQQKGIKFVAEHEVAVTWWKAGYDLLVIGGAGVGKTSVVVRMLESTNGAEGEDVILQNSHVQCNLFRGKLGESRLGHMSDYVITRAAAYRTMISKPFEVEMVDSENGHRYGPTRLGIDMSKRGGTANSDKLVNAERVWHGESMQWVPGLPSYNRAFLEAARKAKGLSARQQIGWDGDCKQLTAILPEQTTTDARKQQLLPLRSLAIEDPAFLDNTRLKLVSMRKVLRQPEPDLARVLSQFSLGMVTDEGWAMAQEFMDTRHQESVKIFSWNNEARDAAFEEEQARCKRHGIVHLAHECPVGEALTESERRGVEERYVWHKMIIIPGEVMLLTMPSDSQIINQYFTFKDGSRAYANMEVTVIGFTEINKNTLVNLKCHPRPQWDDRLSIPAVQYEVYPKGQGRKLMKSWNLKPSKFRTGASCQGQTIDEPLTIDASKMQNTKGLLAMSLTRATKKANISLRGVTSRADLVRKLKPDPKALVIEAALGGDVHIRDLEEAIGAIILNEEGWRKQWLASKGQHS